MSGTQAVGWSFLRSRRWFGYLGMLVLFSLACAWFGNWQFDRRAEAQAEIARIDANYDAPSVPLTEAVAGLTGYNNDQLKWQTVETTGTYIGEPFLARNRPGPEGVGSNLIMPLELLDGTIFFVDRGWVPVAGADEIPANLPAAPSGSVIVEARLRASEPEIFGRTSSGRSVASINLSELSSQLNTERAFTGAYGQLVSETPAGKTGILPAKPERDEGPHLSYALQWYVFILIAVIGVAYAARQEYRNLNAGDASVLREDARRADRRRRRGPTDADVEDALLDA